MAQTLPTSSGVPPSVLPATLRAALERRWGRGEDSSSRYGNKAGKLRQGVDSGCKVRQNKVLWVSGLFCAIQLGFVGR